MKKGRKKPLLISVEDQLEQSLTSNIGPEGLYFINNGIKVSNEGITKLESNSKKQDTKFYSITMNDIESSGKCIGEGVASTVEEGIYKPLNLKVAIKKIKVHDRDKRRQLEGDLKILLENKIQAEINNVGCNFFVTMYGAFYDDGQVKVILELMDIGSLKNVISIIKKAQLSPSQLISEPILARICQQILCGLMHLHIIFKQVHRDIKPANILMNKKGQVKLTDFGVAKELEQTDQKLQSQKGTMAYMSPERIDGAKYSFPSDIWSFGMIVYELCTGKFPFEERSTYFQLHQLFETQQEKCFSLPDEPHFSPELKDFVQRCLQLDENERATAVELQAHPFIMNNLRYNADLSEWLKEVEETIMSRQNAGEDKDKSPVLPQHLQQEYEKLQEELQREIDDSLKKSNISNQN